MGGLGDAWICFAFHSACGLGRFANQSQRVELGGGGDIDSTA